MIYPITFTNAKEGVDSGVLLTAMVCHVMSKGPTLFPPKIIAVKKSGHPPPLFVDKDQCYIINTQREIMMCLYIVARTNNKGAMDIMSYSLGLSRQE